MAKREAYVAEYLTQALLMLMERRPYRDITITEICEKAGVTRMSFYRNFADKEDVLFRHVRSITDVFLEESAISYKRDTTEDYFVKLFSHMGRQRGLCLALHEAGLMHLVKDEFDRVFLEVYRGEYDRYKSAFLAGGIYNVFLAWLEGGCAESPQDMARKMEDMLVK